MYTYIYVGKLLQFNDQVIFWGGFVYKHHQFGFLLNRHFSRYQTCRWSLPEFIIHHGISS